LEDEAEIFDDVTDRPDALEEVEEMLELTVLLLLLLLLCFSTLLLLMHPIVKYTHIVFR
jgi:hypothetical protein